MKTVVSQDEPGKAFARLIAFAPLLFIAHALEEGPGFVAWFNSHVQRGITTELFWQVNLTALIITLVVSAVGWFDRSDVSVIGALAWFSFLFGANAVLHIAGALVDGRYVPGLVTAIVLYVPFFAMIVAHAVSRRISGWALAPIAAVSALPMLVHGYRILFLGERLF